MSSSGKTGFAAGSVPQQYFRSGRYVSAPAFGATGSISQAEGALNAVPLFVPRALTLATVGVEITTSGTAGALLRLGLYSDDGNGFPAALLLDAGTVDATQAPGFYEITINQAVPVGLLWPAVVIQGAAVTKPNTRVLALSQAPISYSSGVTATNNTITSGYTIATGVAGALPNPATGPVTTIINATRLAAKVA